MKVNRMICFVYIPAKKKKQILDKIIFILCILKFTKVKKARTLKKITCIQITFSTPEKITKLIKKIMAFSNNSLSIISMGKAYSGSRRVHAASACRAPPRCRVFALCIRRLVATR